MEPYMESEKRYDVHKFGGTSVGSAECFKKVKGIIDTLESTKLAVVVSAIGGKPKVTDLLLQLLNLARDGSQLKYTNQLTQLKEKHLVVIRELIALENQQELIQVITQDIEDIKDILKAVAIMRTYTERITELISGYGELWSARILAAYLNEGSENYTFIDARKVILVQAIDDDRRILWEESLTLLNGFMANTKNTKFVITGFIASTPEGIATTLRRDGSDYSASIFGRLLGAQSITIWTDVNGVLSADPSRVPEAVVLPHVSYQEAMELAYFGAKVIHPKTMRPAVLEQIPIYIRNTFNPKLPGTRIYISQKKTKDINVRGFSTIDNLALFSVEGSGMLGVHGVANRLFQALERIKANVVLIAQASSEHTICFAIHAAAAEEAKEAINGTFYKEIHLGDIQTVDYITPVSIIAAVGDDMSHTPGVCAKFFAALGRASINIMAISQGSSERNISAVVRYEDSARALRAVHSAFLLSEQAISLGIVGFTGESSTCHKLLEQIQRQANWLKERYHVDIRVRGICDMNRMLLHPKGIDLGNWMEQFEQLSIPLDLASFCNHIRADHIPHWSIVDLTKGDEIMSMYPSWLSNKIHIITGNLSVCSNSIKLQHQIQRTCCENQVCFMMEACVSPGLPILTTVQDLLQTGDTIHEIQAETSGTMCFVLSAMRQDSNQLLSQLAIDAIDLGYTGDRALSRMIEDFTGITSARKAILLAREIGLEIELQDVKIESPIPFPNDTSLWNTSDIIAYLVQYDEKLRELTEQARKEGNFLKLVTSVKRTGEVNVCFKSLPSSHPLSQIYGAQNAVALYTDRYQEVPFVMQAPAAGPTVIASALFTDILKLARSVGARDHGCKQPNTCDMEWTPTMSPSQSLSDLQCSRK